MDTARARAVARREAEGLLEGILATQGGTERRNRACRRGQAKICATGQDAPWSR